MKRLACLFFILHYGMPIQAQNYFQQRVNTRIEVRLDDKAHYLHGFETIDYINNSPDTLQYIYLHLWPNAYRNDRTVFSEQQIENKNVGFYFAKPKDRGFIDSLDLSVDNRKVTAISETDTPDIARIDLPKPLPPGGQIKIETPFRVKIPLVFSRMGHTGQAYYISQWFPKPAVYDRKGWHPLPYTDQGEFFSEVGSYDVSISLPKNYVVMATGNLQNEEENRWLDSLAALPFPEYTVTKAMAKRHRDSLNRFPKSATEYKTLRYTEDNIHDFAFFADKRWIVRKDTTLIPGASEPVAIYAAFLPTEKTYWKRGTEYMKTTLQYLSRQVGPYPYKTVKAVEGDIRAGGGMEYPTVTVVDKLASYTTVMETIVHEVGHNWFYGLLATNERDHPWMDEGFNTLYEEKITRILKSDSLAWRITRITNGIEAALYHDATLQGTDQPINQQALQYTKLNYGLDAYNKSALMLKWLEGYMGEENFTAAMKEYYAKWHYKHPYPEDLRAIFERHAPRPIDWWWDDVLTTDHRIDFALHNRKHRGDVVSIRVKNRTGFAAPVLINQYKDKKLEGSLWVPPFDRDTTVTFPYYHSSHYLVDASVVPDGKIANNDLPTNRLLPHVGFGTGFNRRAKEQIYLLPAIGGNNYDGFMAGMVLHNLTVPGNNFRFIMAPLYGTRSKDFVGAGSVGYFIHPHRTFQEIIAQVDVKSFNYQESSYNIDHNLFARYTKVAPSLTFMIKQPSLRLPVSDAITLKGYFINEQGFNFNLDPVDSLYKPSLASSAATNNYLLLKYAHDNRRVLNPFSFNVEAQMGAQFVKLMVEGKLRIDYNTKGKSLYVRAFAGKYIPIRKRIVDDSRYWLNSTFTGVNDYLYDDTYIGRTETEGIGYRQISMREGGLKVPTAFAAYPIGRSDNWLVALNLKSDLPLTKLPIRLFLDVATYANAGESNPSGDKVLYDGGAEVHIFHDFLLINVPFIMSRDYNDYMKNIYGNKAFGNSITFSLQLQKVNWLKALHDVIRYFY